jgi:hypothetical protein
MQTGPQSTQQAREQHCLPKEPPPGLLMSMAIRYDHALAMPGFYDTLGTGEHAKRVAAALRVMEQLYEEVAGRGFWSPGNDADYVAARDAGLRADEPAPTGALAAPPAALRPETYLDEIEAGRAAQAWLVPMIEGARDVVVSREVRHEAFKAGCGGVMSCWIDGRLIAACIVLRDDFNRSVLVRAPCSRADAPASVAGGEDDGLGAQQHERAALAPDPAGAWVELSAYPDDGDYLWRRDEDDEEPDRITIRGGVAFTRDGRRRFIGGGQWRALGAKGDSG